MLGTTLKKKKRKNHCANFSLWNCVCCSYFCFLIFCHPFLDGKLHENKNFSRTPCNCVASGWCSIRSCWINEWLNEKKIEGVLCSLALPWDLPNSELAGHLLSHILSARQGTRPVRIIPISHITKLRLKEVGCLICPHHTSDLGRTRSGDKF